MDADITENSSTEQTPAHPSPSLITDLGAAADVLERIRRRLQAAVRGRDEAIELILTALFSDGHILLEDFPGSGKTTLAKALGDSILDDDPTDDIVSFRRIQFTPDMLPSDITGTAVFEPNTGRFSFRPGPIFAHIVLADEINRTSPKVQAAMLEAMAEKQITVDNRTRPLDDLFFVIATQNPLDLAGTFPLPAAQLDRFLFKVRMTHISREAELEVLASHNTRRQIPGGDLPRVTRTEILGARAVIDERVYIAPQVRECLVDIAGKTRSDPRILQGASTRSLVLVLPALKTRAVSRGRDFVTADDVQALAGLVFGHRLELAPGEDSFEAVLYGCMAEPLERLARATMRR